MSSKEIPDTYLEYLTQLYSEQINTKGCSYFRAGRFDSRYTQKIDFWWDVENDVFWSFDKIFIKNRLLSHISASQEVINRQ
jgi:hypothetical protein